MHAIKNKSAFFSAVFSKSTRLYQHRSVMKACDSTPPPTPWRAITFPDRCMRLSLSLFSGQSFRWVETGEHPFTVAHGGMTREWAGVIGNSFYLVRQAEPEPPDGVSDPMWYVVAGRDVLPTEDTDEDLAIRDYFHEQIDLTSTVVDFCDADKAYNHLFPYLRGVRLLRQSPTEALFAYICSSCNNIKRITLLVRYLASRYGDPIREYADEQFFSFPTAETLAKEADEMHLREAGFGYRAKSIVETANQVVALAKKEGKTTEEMLLEWRLLPREDVAKKLVQFTGVGKKVAGCIALTSLDKYDEIPCDTHIWQIAQRYLPEIRQKSLTDRVYTTIGDFFRAKFGKYAGFAHNVLFVAELNDYKKLYPEINAMDAFWASLEESTEQEDKNVKKNNKKNGVSIKAKAGGVAKKVKKPTAPTRRSSRRTTRIQ